MMCRDKMIQRIRAVTLCLLVVFSFGATGEICGVFFEKTEAVFGNKFPDNKPKDIRAVVSRIEKAGIPVGKPGNSRGIPVAVVVVKANPRAIIGVDLSADKQLWRVDTAVSSAITIAGDLFLFKSGNRVVAYDVLSGEKRWDYKLDEGWDYFGADADGQWAALSIGVGGTEPGGYANSKIVVLNASNGLMLWEHSGGSGLLGNPLVIKDMVFAPWDRQKIVVIDIPNEKEICRIRAEDYAVNFLRKSSGGVYIGSSASKKQMASLYRVNESSANGRREGVTMLMPDLVPIPGVAHFGRDTFQRRTGGRSTDEKIQFHWHARTAPSSDIALSGDQFFLHYWRYVIAFDVKTSAVNWTFISPTIIESASALSGGGVLAADTRGGLFYIDGKTGREAWRTELEEEVLTAYFDADGFIQSSGEKAEPPEVGLLRLILDNDNRMLPIRAYSALLLGQIPKPEITRDLLKIYSSAGTPKLLKKAVEKAVETRTTGAEYIVKALDTTYDYLERTEPPPMKIVAPTLSNMDARDSVPGLLKHLMNHETPIDSLPYILAAIHKLGDASVAADLRQFLTVYHADSSFIKHEQVLASAAHTLLKFGDKESSERFIADLRSDPQTLIDLKILLKKALNPQKTAEEEADKKARKEAERLAKAKAERIAKEAALVPNSLSREQIHYTIQENQELFRPCIMDALKKSPTLENIRMRFVLTGKTGIASNVKVLPNNIPELGECLEEAFELIQFRHFKLTRQTSTYTIQIKTAPSAEEAPEKEIAAPF